MATASMTIWNMHCDDCRADFFDTDGGDNPEDRGWLFSDGQREGWLIGVEAGFGTDVRTYCAHCRAAHEMTVTPWKPEDEYDVPKARPQRTPRRKPPFAYLTFPATGKLTLDMVKVFHAARLVSQATGLRCDPISREGRVVILDTKAYDPTDRIKAKDRRDWAARIASIRKAHPETRDVIIAVRKRYGQGE